MKTREERAREYVYNNFLEATIWAQETSNAFIAGAEVEHAELTRWNDPKERPELYMNVQVKYNTPLGTTEITTAWLGINSLNEWLWTIAGTADLIDDSIIIGWREIHQ